ncbi:MAG: hypothetical protein MO852_06190 [Candidatus Devosia euplotis]|nr:hypothetical protein [Candidatus Devosia euplotis]
MRFVGSENPLESAIGTNGQAFDTEAFAASLHEWRLFEKTQTREEAGRHELG